MNYSISATPNYVFLKLAKVPSKDDVLHAIQEIAPLLKNKRILLIDSKDLKFPFNLSEKHSFFVELSENKVDKSIQIITITNFLNEEHSLLEMVAKNRGWKLKNFHYREQADRLIQKIIHPVLVSTGN
ncbi:hypothetical protein [Flammeovirga sp. SJP92]|uniref:hypothetical protein n=1 Tax=Flammeovirga sp. SJP92 TaxID=1775430 RepID=UPI000788470E|nr:hypothetical protein [Flammeovirga sp. SJP92]KXX69723.1 hypothetical protein AVL50_12575 [Flammeovirga sp. SJP92]